MILLEIISFWIKKVIKMLMLLLLWNKTLILMVLGVQQNNSALLCSTINIARAHPKWLRLLLLRKFFVLFSLVNSYFLSVWISSCFVLYFYRFFNHFAFASSFPSTTLPSFIFLHIFLHFFFPTLLLAFYLYCIFS